MRRVRYLLRGARTLRRGCTHVRACFAATRSDAALTLALSPKLALTRSDVVLVHTSA